MKRVGLCILSFVSAVLASLIGVVVSESVLQNKVWLLTLTIIFLLPLLLLVFNVSSQRHFVKKMSSLKVADINTFLNSHRNDAEKTAKEKFRELQRIRRFTALYTVLIALTGIASAVFGGVLAKSEFIPYIIFILYSAMLFCSVYSRIHKKTPLAVDEDVVTISQNDYPVIYSLASKAAKSVGYEKEILIIPEWDCSASILCDNKRAYLTIGVVLLDILTEEELYAILLHEFAHISNDSARLREQQYYMWLLDKKEGMGTVGTILSGLYLRLDGKYIFTYSIYKYAATVIDELNADRLMAEHSDPGIAASALLKAHYDSFYNWEHGVNNEKSAFESEELEANYLTCKIAAFKEAITVRSAFWNSLVSKEILANNASHPTLKMRFDALGIEKIALTESKSSEAYLAEVKKLLQFSEETIYESRIKTYEADRKENYSEPLSRIDAWNNAGCPIAAETYADIISDLRTLGRREEAQDLCDRVLKELPEGSTHYAAYMKGAAMLVGYDEKGLDFIYHAMEENGNYVEEGLNLIGSFCCLTGRKDALAEYRKKAVELGQKHIDEDEQIGFLSKNDHLTKETLPDGMLEEILTFIHSVDQGIIQKIYLIRKTVSETFFASVFIIHFYGGTDKQRNEIMHKIFRYLDSYPVNWQFALFDYFEYPEIKVENIEGSLVYSKKED